MRTTVWALILVSASFLCVRGQESGKGSTASAILVLEHTWFDEESRNDNGALYKIFDNDLVYIENGRPMTKGEYLASLKSAGPHSQELVLESTTVQTFGSTAIAVGTYRQKTGVDGKLPLRRWRFVDTWVNRKGSWTLIAAGSSLLSK